MNTNTKAKIKVWDLPTRVFHWSLAASFAGAYVLSESERLRNVHVMLGYTVLALLAFRVVWGFVGSRYARFGSFRYGPLAALRYLRDAVTGRPAEYTGHNPAGSWAVYAILLLGLGTGISGYLQYNDLGGEAFEEVHEVLANAWLAVVGAHLFGVLFSSLVHRENLARAMVTGYKRGAASAAIAGTAPAVGAVVALAVAGFWGWTLLGGGLPVPSPGSAQGPQQSALSKDADFDDD